MAAPETGFDVNLERKQWSMRTGPQQLFATRNRQGSEDAPLEPRTPARHTLPRAFHDAIAVPAPPKPPPPPPKTEHAIRVEATASHPDTPAVRLCWLQSGYVAALVLMAISVPVFLNHGPFAVCYIMMCAAPLWLATFTLHALSSMLCGDSVGPLLTGALLSISLPVLFITLRYLPITDGRPALYAALLLMQSLYGCMAGRHWRTTTTTALALFLSTAAATELSPWDRDWALSALCIWNTVATCSLGIWSLYCRDHVAFAVSIWGDANA